MSIAGLADLAVARDLGHPVAAPGYRHVSYAAEGAEGGAAARGSVDEQTAGRSARVAADDESRTQPDTTAGARRRSGARTGPGSALNVLAAVIPIEVITLYSAFVIATSERVSVTGGEVSADSGGELAAALQAMPPQSEDLLWWRAAVFVAGLAAVLLPVWRAWSARMAAEAPIRRKGESRSRRRVPVAELFAAGVAFTAWAAAMPAGFLGVWVDRRDVTLASLGVATAAALVLYGVGLAVLQQTARPRAKARAGRDGERGRRDREDRSPEPTGTEPTATALSGAGATGAAPSGTEPTADTGASDTGPAGSDSAAAGRAPLGAAAGKTVEQR